MSNEHLTLEEMEQKYPDGKLLINDSNINGDTDNFELLRKSYVLSLVIPFFLGIWCIFYLTGCTFTIPPGDPATIYYSQGVKKVNIKDYEGAIKDFSKAIEKNRNFAMAYYKRGVILRQLDEGSYWAGKRDFSTALTLAEQQKDKSLSDLIRDTHKKIYRSPYVHSHNIFDGDSAIRKLKKFGYKIERLDDGYKLTKIKTVPSTYSTKHGTVVTGERIVGKIEDKWLIGLYGNFQEENGMGWAVDRKRKIWLAVPDVIVDHRN